MMATRLLFTGVAFAVIAASAAFAGAQEASRAPRLYSAAQAVRGEALYKENCGFCHGPELAGTLSAPPIDGKALSGRWLSKPLGELVAYVEVFMPWNSPGGLSRQHNAD